MLPTEIHVVTALYSYENVYYLLLVISMTHTLSFDDPTVLIFDIYNMTNIL